MEVGEYLQPDERAPWIIDNYVELSLSTSNNAPRTGLVCVSVVDRAVGEVFCRYMKEMFLSKIYVRDKPRGYTGRLYDGRIDCSGDELHLSDCDVSLHQVSLCEHGCAMIECTSSKQASCRLSS